MHKSTELLSRIVTWNKYARFNYAEKRRERYEEIVDRNKQMHIDKFPQLTDEINAAYEQVYSKNILPSMRSFQFAGDAIRQNNARIFNCSYLPIERLQAFQELMFLLLSGCGVGYSVRRRHVEALGTFYPLNGKKTEEYIIPDSIEGWAMSIDFLIKSLKDGYEPVFDYSKIRKRGERLIVGGGKAPGAEPLRACHQEIINYYQDYGPVEPGALEPIMVHDICCLVSEAVMAGGIRRAAMISLFDHNDGAMLHCKSGEWWMKHPYRARANNSAILDRNISREEFDFIWKKVEESNAGEPGLFWTDNLFSDTGTNPCCFTADMRILTSKGYKRFDECVGDGLFVNKDNKLVNGKVWSNGVKDTINLRLYTGEVISCTPEHRFMLENGEECEAKDLLGKKLMSNTLIIPAGPRNPMVVSISVGESREVFDFSLDDDTHWGIVEGVIAHNCEIALRPYTFCNLVEVNVTNDNEENLRRVKAAALIATLQASYTDFKFLSPEWKINTDEDALIGVGLTGIAGSNISEQYIWLAQAVKGTNAEVAAKIGINTAARCTTVKPSGTASIVLGTSSGIHAWHSKYYIRRMRISKNDALYSYIMKQAPFLVEDDFFKPQETAILSFPIKAPDGAITREDETALEFTKRCMEAGISYVRNGQNRGDLHNNVSATVSVKKSEWKDLGTLMYSGRNYYNGMSVLPYDDSVYKQAPFETITEEEYLRLEAQLEGIDLDPSSIIEEDDLTELIENSACAGGACELV